MATRGSITTTGLARSYSPGQAGTARPARHHQPPPRDSNHPIGAYFTTLSPRTKRLCQQLKIPREKTEFVFAFQYGGGLRPLQGGKGDRIYFSEVDYIVEKARQLSSRSGEAAQLPSAEVLEDYS